jgi:hypothetical protein
MCGCIVRVISRTKSSPVFCRKLLRYLGRSPCCIRRHRGARRVFGALFGIFSHSLSLFRSNFHRLGPVPQCLIKEATDIPHWSFLWYLTPVAILSCALRNHSERQILLVICSIAPIVVYCCTSLFSAWPDYFITLYLRFRGFCCMLPRCRCSPSPWH